MNNIEFLYMSGLPIDMTDKNLGIIYQPKLKDFIERGIDIENFSHPFILNKDMISSKNEQISNILNKVGRLEFLFVYDELTSMKRELTNTKGVVEVLIESLKLLYKTDNIMVITTLSSILVDNKVIISNDNFDLLSNLALEMTRVDVKKMRKMMEDKRKKEEEEEKNPLLKKFNELEREYKEQTSKKDDLTLIDIANIVIHSQSIIDYDKTFNLTIYQLKNSYETLMKKEIFNVNLMHRISPNFQPTNDFNLWEEKVNVIKSELS